MPEKPETRVDAYKRRLLDHKFLSIIILLGVIVIGLATCSDSVWKLVDSYKRVADNDEPSTDTSLVVSVAADDLKITKVRRILDQPTTIRDFADSGVMSLYWELTLSNNGKDDLSIIDYEILQVLNQGLSNYTGLQQGLYTLEADKLHPVQLPVVIPAGHALAFFIRVGVRMDKAAYELVKTEFDGTHTQDVSKIIDFLRSRETDVFGNPYKKNEFGSSLPSMDDLQDPIFGVSFETARGVKTNDIISWYKYGLFRDIFVDKDG